MNTKLLWGVACGLSLCIPAAVAKKAPQTDFDYILPHIPTSEYDALGRWAGERPLTRYRLSVPTQGTDARSRAEHFLAQQREMLQLPTGVELRHLLTRATAAGSNVHFEQYVGDTPVYNGRVVVHLNPAELVTHLAANPAPVLLGALRPALLTAEQAREKAIARVNASGPFRLLEATEVIYPAADASYRVWKVNLIAATPSGDWEVLIDALDGRVHAVWDRAAYASASVFDPDPLSSSQTVYGQPITDADDADYPEIAAEVYTKELVELNKIGSLSALSSSWAELVDLEAPYLGTFVQKTPDYLFNRSEDGFEASNVFWHIDESMRYINSTLGIPLRPYQYEGGVRFDPHGLDGDDNSYYSTGSGAVVFGEGCVDDAEDADVVRHELGHGIHDWVTAGGLSNIIDGLSEGFGDYWAHSYSRSKGHWQPDTDEYHWVFNWDGHNECWGGRVTNYALPWPAGITPYPAIHGGGQIFSTCMMEVFDQLGREATDTIVLEGLAMTTMISSQNDAANAIWQAASDLGFSADDLGYLNTQLASCGYIMAAPLGIDLPPPFAPDPAAAEEKQPRATVEAGTVAGGALGQLLVASLLLLGLRRRVMAGMRG